MGRRSETKSRHRRVAVALRSELEMQIEQGRCAYCRVPARPDKPLTREHVIPRAKGGRRNDFRIIVPACARCNHSRGCRDLIPFLLARPQRVSSFLDYLGGLSAESLREVDPRILAELYAAIAILRECAAHGARWRWERSRLCSGRSLHRRRYAARRAVGAVSGRLEAIRAQGSPVARQAGPVAAAGLELPPLPLDEPLETMAGRLLGLFALVWEVSAETVEREISRELRGSAVGRETPSEAAAAGGEVAAAEVVPLDGWKARRRRKRARVDRRQARGSRVTVPARGRAA